MRKKPHTILTVDDDVKLTSLVEKFLRAKGFEVIVRHSAARILDVIEEKKPDVVLLDVLLPDGNGLDACKEIRAKSRVPLIILSAQGNLTDRVIGLEVGADDYLTKPFEPDELLARIRALLRRAEDEQDGDILAFDDLKIDTRRKLVFLDDKLLKLTTTEFDVLLLLALHPGEVLGRDEIHGHLHGANSETLNRSIDIAVSRLRTKLGDKQDEARFIRTIWGTGYVFIGRRNKAA